jgi:hypothetical protein
MTRFLSDSLQAPEPFFRQGLNRLEKANGSPNNDIRVSLDVMNASRDKLRQLGLDPADTTPAELYYSLLERVKADDKKLTKTLRTLAATYVSADGDVVTGMVHALKQLPDSRRCFALKTASFKAIMKKVPPKKAMKHLGYRSVDSFLKHESPISILAASQVFEGKHWHDRLGDSYKKLTSRDFEDRNVSISILNSGRWADLADKLVNETRHNVISFKELGALAFFRLPDNAPPGAVTASLSLGLHELNEILASSTYLKMCQVRPDFGSLVKKLNTEELQLSSKLLDSPLPWPLIQRYFAQFKQFGSVLSDSHLELQDIAWHPIEKTLSEIEPAFDFWKNSSHLGILKSNKPVSLNLIDAALNCCNSLAFEQRVYSYFQNSLWHELLLRYLKPEALEQTILRELQPRMAEELAIV